MKFIEFLDYEDLDHIKKSFQSVRNEISISKEKIDQDLINKFENIQTFYIQHLQCLIYNKDKEFDNKQCLQFRQINSKILSILNKVIELFSNNKDLNIENFFLKFLIQDISIHYDTFIKIIE